MKLDFNETNILLQSFGDLEKQYGAASIDKTIALEFLKLLHDNTSNEYVFLLRSIASLMNKLESLSNDNITQILSDKAEGKIIATTGYVLPEA